MAAPFVGDAVSVATDGNEITLRNPPSRGVALASRRVRLSIVVVEVLLEPDGVEPQSCLVSRAETYGTETFRVVVDPGAGDGIARRDLCRREPLLGLRRLFSAKDLGHTSSDPLDAVGIEVDAGVVLGELASHLVT
jgi:hypothetical protein